MSCHKVSRALQERIRFGELDADCDKYLEHLERCPDCQEAIAVDRALATELRRTLRERVAGFEPSPAVWRAVRLQAGDPEPPGPWWSRSMLAVGQAMRVMVPVTAIMLAAVLFVGRPEIGGAEPAQHSALASELQREMQLQSTAVVEMLKRRIEVIPAPRIQLPRPGGEMAYPETIASVKVSFGPPTAGGVIR